MKTFEGKLDGASRRFAIVAARFNELIVDQLVAGAASALRRHGVDDDDIVLFRVPGALEIPAVAARVAATDSFDALICLGAVIRGATPHFDVVVAQSATGIAKLAQSSQIPVVNGVLTCDSIEQAIERAGTKAGNKGADVAIAAIELASLYGAIDGSLDKGSPRPKASGRGKKS